MTPSLASGQPPVSPPLALLPTLMTGSSGLTTSFTTTSSCSPIGIQPALCFGLAVSRPDPSDGKHRSSSTRQAVATRPGSSIASTVPSHRQSRPWVHEDSVLACPPSGPVLASQAEAGRPPAGSRPTTTASACDLRTATTIASSRLPCGIQPTPGFDLASSLLDTSDRRRRLDHVAHDHDHALAAPSLASNQPSVSASAAPSPTLVAGSSGSTTSLTDTSTSS
jgi:hypothetical protein